MFKSKKTLLICLILLLLLIFLCLCTKLSKIYNEVYPQTNVEIIKKDSKVVVNGTFNENTLVNETINEFKMSNTDASKGDIKINNDIQAKGKWQNIMLSVAPFFTKFKEGELSFKNNKLDISGTTFSQKAKDGITSSLEKLKADGIEVSDPKIDLLEPKFTDISITKKDSKVTLNGTFKSEKQVEETITRLKMFNDDVQRGDIKIDADIHESDKWNDVVQNVSYYFSNNLEDGNLVFKGNKLQLKGSTLSPKAKDEFTGILDNLKAQGINVDSSNFNIIEARTAKQKAKKDIYELLHSKTIEFETGKNLIKPESNELLDRIVEELTTYNTLNILIEGHTDDVGSDKSNQTLSESRAMAIKEYLIAKGIDSNRLSTIGYGEYRPAVPNNSDENRQKNRRVEFKIKGE